MAIARHALRALAAVCLVTLLATRADPADVYISGADGATADTTNVDSLEFVEHGADADINLITGARSHDSNSVGDSASRHSILASPATNISAYYSLTGVCSGVPSATCQVDLDCPVTPAGACAGPLGRAGCGYCHGNVTGPVCVDNSLCGAAYKVCAGKTTSANVQCVTSATCTGTAPTCVNSQCVGAVSGANPAYCLGMAQAGASVSVNLDTATSSATTNDERLVVAVLEGLNSDPGCYATVKFTGGSWKFALHYGNNTPTNTNPGQHLTWGVGTEPIKTYGCTASPQLPCTTATQATDCPGDTCSQGTGSIHYKWYGVHVNQINQGGSAVTCELYIDGVPLFTATACGTGSVGACGTGVVQKVVDLAIGPGNVGGITTVGKAVEYLDDVVVDDVAIGGRFGYVTSLFPAQDGLPTNLQWPLASQVSVKRCVNGTTTVCTTGADCPGGAGCGYSVFAYETMRDYMVSPYALYQVGSDDSVHIGKEARKEYFSASTAVGARPLGSVVNGLSVALIGRTDAGNSDRTIEQSLAVCPVGACKDLPCQKCTGTSCVSCTGAGCFCQGTHVACTSGGTQCNSTCANEGAVGVDCQGASGATLGNWNDRYCCVISVDPIRRIVTTGNDVANWKLFDRFLLNQAPVAADSDWGDWLGAIGSGFETVVSTKRDTRVGASVVYADISMLPLSPEGVTLADHNAQGASCLTDSTGGPSNKGCGGVSGACNTGTHLCTSNNNSTPHAIKDGLVTVFALGDSTLYGTLESTCEGGGPGVPGTPCSGPSYCSWDTTERDKPSGGCGTANTPSADARCQTCAARHAEFNGTAGYPCGINNLDDLDNPLSCCLGTYSAGTCNTTGSCVGGNGTCGSRTGTCTGGVVKDATVSCGCNGDCNLGNCAACDTPTCVGGSQAVPTYYCSESCPGGECPAARSGWSGNIPTLVNVDTLVKCGVGSEDTAQMLQNRFADTLVGKGIQYFGGNCVATSGSGRCYCGTTGALCPGGSCGADFLCTGGTSAKCQQPTDCPSVQCNFPPPDYVVTIEGYNDIWTGNFFESGAQGGSKGRIIDPECSTGATFMTFGGPPKWCPQVGATAWPGQPATYKCAATACTADAQCGGVGATCLGVNRKDDTNCNLNGFFSDCTAMIDDCTISATCPVGSGGTQPTCVAPSATLTVVPTLVTTPLGTGKCRCTVDGDCPAINADDGWACIGPVGAKTCRRKCTTNASCTTGTGSATCDSAYCTAHPTECSGGAGMKFCTGRCSCPCSAITCGPFAPTDAAATAIADAKCGSITMTERMGGIRARTYTGRCNPASSQCGNCGQQNCVSLAETAGGGCSCATSADCGTGMTCGPTNTCVVQTPSALPACTRDGCTAGKYPDGTICTDTAESCVGGQCVSGRCYPRRAICRFDTQCGLGQRCMTTLRNLSQYQANRHLAFSVFSEMTDIAASDLTNLSPPKVLFGGLPAIGGLTAVNPRILPDGDCVGFGVDRGYSRALITDMLDRPDLFPPLHVIDFRNTEFDLNRFTQPYHGPDDVHYSPPGARVVAATVADAFNRLNICLDTRAANVAQWTPQKYCRLLAGAWVAASGSDAVANPKVCATQTDCAGSGLCVRRQCNGNNSNTSASGCPCAVGKGTCTFDDQCGLD